MAVGKFRHEAGKQVFNFRFNHSAVYEFEKQHGGAAIGHLIPGTIAVSMCVDLMALSLTGLPGKEKTLDKKRRMVLKMLDDSTENIQYFQEKVLEGIGVMLFDKDELNEAKAAIGGSGDEDPDGDDDEDDEDPSDVDGTKS